MMAVSYRANNLHYYLARHNLGNVHRSYDSCNGHHRHITYDVVGQGYGNGANMKKKNYGPPRKIINLNIRVFFAPCAAHSLNLVQLTFQIK
jgi:hypothetical protein